MLFKMPHALILALALLMPACDSVREYKDENALAAKANDEKSQQSAFYDRFDKKFEEKENEYGIRETKSNKVSSYQSKIDDARDSSKSANYSTSSFSGGKESSFGSKDYNGGKRFLGGKDFQGGKESAISRNKRPGFLQEGKGVSAQPYTSAERRSRSESMVAQGTGSKYSAPTSNYKTEKKSGYVESRLDQGYDVSEVTTSNRSQQQPTEKSVQDTRDMLGRE